MGLIAGRCREMQVFGKKVVDVFRISSPPPRVSWRPFDGGKSIGQSGSEVGSIIRDDEHSDGARITLERATQNAPFAITCGIYGWMLHTRFLGTEAEAQREFEIMKAELSRIIATIPLRADPLKTDSKSQAVSESLSEFVRRFP
jgi:hypothetical protein